MKSKLKHLLEIISLTFLGIIFSLLSFNKTNVVVKAIEEETLLNIDYRVTPFSSSEKESYYHVSGSNSAHGVVPTKEWKNESEASQGYIIYKINVTSGFVINTLSLSMDALISNNGNLDPSIPGNTSISVYLSKNSNDFVTPAITFSSLSDSEYTYESNLSDYAKGYRTFFMKVELNHPTGTFVLNRIGTKLYSLLLTGNLVSKSLKCTHSNSVYFDYDFSSVNTLSGIDVNNLEVGSASSWSGLKLTSKATESNGSIVFHVTPYLEGQLETLSLNISNSRFAYYFGSYGNYLSVLTSFDGINYSPFDKKLGSESVISSFNYDFSMFFVGQIVTDFYIKIELGTTTKGCGFDDTWIILQKIQITGKESSHDFTFDGDNYTCLECGKSFQISTLNPIEIFINTYMHMNENVAGQCVLYYLAAKEAYLNLTTEQRRLFLIEDEYEEARNRLISWANYHNETITVENIFSNNSLNILKKNNYLIISLSVISLTGVISFIIIKNRKTKLT